MAYFIPIRMLKIGPEISIPVHRITLIGTSNSFTLKSLALEHKKKKTLINASGREVTKSIVLLDNGAVCTSSYTASYLNKKINDLQRFEVTSDIINNIGWINRAKANEKEEPENIDTDELLRQIKESLDGDEEDYEDEDEANTDT